MLYIKNSHKYKIFIILEKHYFEFFGRIMLFKTLLTFLFSLNFFILNVNAGSKKQSFLPDTVLHISKIEELSFSSNQFVIAGNLYLPINNEFPKYPLVIWVSGSGPSFRTIKNADTKKLVNCFLDAGYAYFRMDKPGSGDSKGILNDDSLFSQRSDIVVDAVKLHEKHT